MSHLTIILDGSIFNSYFLDKLYGLGKKYKIFDDDQERLYDWVITEAIRKVTETIVFRHINVDNHVGHDVFQCVYDEIGLEVENTVRTVFAPEGVRFLRGNRLKILITFRDIFIVVKQTNFSGGI